MSFLRCYQPITLTLASYPGSPAKKDIAKFDGKKLCDVAKLVISVEPSTE